MLLPSSSANEDSNDAFSLLGQIIVKAHGSKLLFAPEYQERYWTFEDIIEDDIIAPMGLTHTFFFPPTDLREYIVVSNTRPGDSAVVDLDLAFMNPYAMVKIL